jgi:hypothetical protein
MIRKVLLLFTLLSALVVLLPVNVVEPADAWGFYGHKRINRLACFTLPPDMFPFFKRHIDFISDESVGPDRRRYAVTGEAPRHYIDIDHYAKAGGDPFEIMPRKWNDAVAKFSEDTLQAYGIVPWHIEVMFKRLVTAMQRGNVDLILKNATDLGHYVGDAHVPLHTTENYNGQLTNQHGIHAFWESRIPEISAENYDHLVGRALYIDSPLDAAWEAVYDSHMLLDSVFGIERRLSIQFPEDRKYAYEQRGNSRTLTRSYSREFTLAYEEAMKGMVERRMNASILSLGNIWYSAWVVAGQPDLERFEQKTVSDSLKKVIKAEQELMEANRKGYGREHE